MNPWSKMGASMSDKKERKEPPSGLDGLLFLTKAFFLWEMGHASFQRHAILAFFLCVAWADAIDWSNQVCAPEDRQVDHSHSGVKMNDR